MYRSCSFHVLSRALIVAAALLFIQGMTRPVIAHPADEINERDAIHISPGAITIDIAISAGALTLRRLWSDADTNADAILDRQEQDTYGAFLARGIQINIDGVPVSLTYVPDTLDMKRTLRDFQLQGADATGATVLARCTAPFDGLGAPHEVTVAVQHYTHVEYGRPAELSPDATAPLGIIVQGGSDVALRMTTTPGGPVMLQHVSPPQNPNHRSVTMLQRFVRFPATDFPFMLTGLGIAMLLGALHALTPGHGKTLVAAYMIGSKGRIRDAVTLGGVVTITHTGSVIVVGLALLVFSRALAPDRFLPWLEVVGCLTIVGLGIALIPSRVSAALLQGRRARTRMFTETPIAEHEHDDGTRHAHNWFGTVGHEHPTMASADLRSVIILGFGGGIIPCPDALAILLIAVAAGHIITGIIILLGFSVGLAAVLTGLGILMATVRFTHTAPGRFLSAVGISRWLPVTSAVMIVAIGLSGLWHAIARLR